MLYAVILQCKSSEGSDCFVQDVTCVLEPMAVLATDQQLFDLERFCCDPLSFPYVQFSANSTKGADVLPLVHQAIKHLTQLGLYVVTITCDDASDN